MTTGSQKLLSRMFRVLTGERITKVRYTQLLKEFSEGQDTPVDPDAIRLINDVGIIYVSDGLIIEEWIQL